MSRLKQTSANVDWKEYSIFSQSLYSGSLISIKDDSLVQGKYTVVRAQRAAVQLCQCGSACTRPPAAPPTIKDETALCVQSNGLLVSLHAREREREK